MAFYKNIRVNDIEKKLIIDARTIGQLCCQRSIDGKMNLKIFKSTFSVGIDQLYTIYQSIVEVNFPYS